MYSISFTNITYVKESPMSCYPVLMTRDVAATAAFYRDHLGFETTFEADWYVSLRRGTHELAVLDAGHPTVPAGHGRPASGVLINLEVDDVDAEYRRLVLDGPLDALLPIRSEEFGQRHFIVAAPDGVLIDVITEIPAGESYEDAFTEAYEGSAR
jgi:catechol 2,3-dioxygenase-like lactoylglutathione lyase family enzyme